MDPVQVGTTVLGWEDILKIVLASGVVAAAIGWIKDWIFKQRDRSRDAKFSAIGVIAKLDLYALQSRTNVRNYFEHVASLDPHRDYLNWPSCSYPETGITNEELKCLSYEYASDLAWIATEKALASHHLYAVHEAARTPIDVYRHEANVVGYFGYEAYILAGKLRKKYSLPSFGKRWGTNDEFVDLLHSWMETKAAVSRVAKSQQDIAD